jgi:tetratricopeptide (TPR) repeat protein
MPDRPFLSRFTPSRNDPEILEAIFVQRHELARDTVERIHESAVSGNMHHLLFIGPRGSGKTHFVSLIFNRLTRREDLHERLRIAWLGEDETTTSFLDLLLRIYRALQQRYAKEFPADALQALYELRPPVAAKCLGKLLVENLAGRTLLVIVENMDALFAGLKAAGQKQWRAFIQENAVFTTLATSQQLFEGVSRRDSPFYGSFQIEHLKPLTVAEAVLLLKKIAELSEDTNLAAFLQTPAGRARVRALHHLSGGNHRIYIVLSQFLTRETLDGLIGPFEKLIDELTPYYQARVNWLSPQQRKLVEFLCGCQHPVPVTEIARPLFITHQTATGQLKELREKGYVQSHARGRESLYELTEPLMRMCVELKENRREPIRLVIDFLRIWCTPGQLQKLPTRSSMERQYLQSAMQAFDRGEEDLRVRSILRDLEDQQQAGQPGELIGTLEELTETRGHADDWVFLSHALGKAGRHTEALAACDKALELDPNHARGWIHRGVILRTLNRYEEALAAYDKVLALDPTYASAAWNNRGAVLGTVGRHAEALVAFDKALELDPKYVSAWIGRGFALKALGHQTEALAAVDKALEVAPTPLGWVEMGKALVRLGRYEDALAAYDKALALDPNYLHAWLVHGIALVSLGRYEEALSSWAKALKLDPNYLHAWMGHSILLVLLGRHADALAAYERVLALDPKHVTSWNGLGMVLVSLGQHAEALAAFDKAIALDPNRADAWAHRGNALSALGRYDEALAASDKALELDPKELLTWNGRAIILGDMGRNEEAMTVYERSLAVEPKDVAGWNARGVALVFLGRHDEALAAFEEALALDPKDVGGWSGRCIVLLNRGRHEEALAASDKALELVPKFPYFWANRGDALQALGRHAEALAAYDQVLELDSKAPDGWSHRGDALWKLGRHEQALVAYDKALELDPKAAHAWNGRGVALENLGRHEEALAAFDQALDRQPTDPLGAFNRVEPLLLLDRWEPGFAALRESLKEFPPSVKGYAGDTKALVNIMMAGSLEKAVWQQRICRFVAIYAEAQALTYLGDGLVRSLATLCVNMLSAEALAAWRDVWHDAGAGHDQLIIPLRIFVAGIRYLQTKDRRALLDLLTEERKILAEALGIGYEPE